MWPLRPLSSFDTTTTMSTSAPSSRPSKRARQALVPASPAPTRSPALFAPFRSLGHISTSVPFALLSRSNKFADKPSLTVLTSLGKSWALWEGEGLRLLFVGTFFLSSRVASSPRVGAGTELDGLGRSTVLG
jgi:hypothetical protein